MLHVTAVRRLGGTRLWVEFDDGRAGEVDLAPVLGGGPVFEPLRDPALFAEVVVDPLLRTLVWPNGADLAPEYIASLLDP